MTTEPPPASLRKARRGSWFREPSVSELGAKISPRPRPEGLEIKGAVLYAGAALRPSLSPPVMAKPGVYVDPSAILRLLVDIKVLWDEHGLGDDDAVSEPLHNRLNAAIKELQG